MFRVEHGPEQSPTAGTALLAIGHGIDARDRTLRRIEQYVHQWRSWHDYLSPALLERLPGAHQGIRRLCQSEIRMALRLIKLDLAEFCIKEGQTVLK